MVINVKLDYNRKIIKFTSLTPIFNETLYKNVKLEKKVRIMTTIHTEEIECPVCGERVSIHMIMSTNYMGHSDLDLRPPEMGRSTMYQTTSTCKCGNVFDSFDSSGSRELIESDNYKNCDGIPFQKEWPKTFYRVYLIDKENESSTIKSQFFHILRCAWACDDYSDNNSVKVRMIALDLINQIIDDEEFDEERKDNLLVKADLLRRSGQFDQLIDEYSDMEFDEELYQKILDFQINKSIEKDDACYTVEDALK